MWDESIAVEADRFNQALQTAQLGLVETPGSYRSQNTSVRPIPVVPRNAAIKLVFDRDLALTTAFFAANPAAVQLLLFTADPGLVPARQAFLPVSHRVLAQGDSIIIDTTLIGAEASGGLSSSGLPPSLNNTTANIRIAIPSSGLVASQLNIEPDPVTALNGPGASGEPSVIRDFRSGNINDGPVGSLLDIEAPGLIAEVGMGIVEIDTTTRVITLNKRFSQVAVRGRIPFVDGGIVPSVSLPGGPAQIPTDEPLRSGDILSQEVRLPSGELVRLRAEVLQNEDVGNVVNPTGLTLGLTANGDDGGSASVVRVRVASLVGGVDSSGNEVRFQASSLPLGADCVVRVHYYHQVPYNANFGSVVLSDQSRVHQFLVFDPAPPVLGPNRSPVTPGTMVDPFASVSLRFSEPVDLQTVDRYNNYLLSNDSFKPSPGVTVSELLADPKASSLSMIATRLVDNERTSTLLRLSPPLGLFHQNGASETTYFHLLASGSNLITDLAGNRIDLFDRDLLAPLDALSIPFSLDPAGADNLVGSIVRRFEAVDEDGTPTGTEDYFGQFQIFDGKLGGAATTRFSQIADQQTLSPILRFDKGECWMVDPAMPMNSMTVAPGSPPGQLYQCPSHVVTRLPPVQPPFGTAAVTFGGVVEPMQPHGSRLQMTYREDDFTLSYTDPSTFMLDIEQMHWAPWNGRSVEFDVFDRVSIEAAHADWRPDLLYFLNTYPAITPPPAPTCDLDCASLFSGLQTTFASNVLEGSAKQALVTDRVYEMDPNDSFQGATGTVFTPYPRFEQSYTWRDSRHVSWDRDNQVAIGLSGAKQPDGTFPGRDRTANVSSPWNRRGAAGPSGRVPRLRLDGQRGRLPRRPGPRPRPDRDAVVARLQGVPGQSDQRVCQWCEPCAHRHRRPVAGASSPRRTAGTTPPSAAVLLRATLLIGRPSASTRAAGSMCLAPRSSSTRRTPSSRPAVGSSTLAWAKLRPHFGLIRTPAGRRPRATGRRSTSCVSVSHRDRWVLRHRGVRTGTSSRRATRPSEPASPPHVGSPIAGRSSHGAGRRPQRERLHRRSTIRRWLSSRAGTALKVELRGVRQIGAEGFEPVDLRPVRGPTTRYSMRGNLLNPSYACEAYRYAMATSSIAGSDDAARRRLSGLTALTLRLTSSIKILRLAARRTVVCCRAT